MPRKQDLGTKLFEILHCLWDLWLVEGSDEVVAAYDGVQRDSAPCKFYGVL
jgi:hypothetical protein